MDAQYHAYHPNGPGLDATQQPGLEVVVHDQSAFLPEVQPNPIAGVGKEQVAIQTPGYYTSTQPLAVQPFAPPAPAVPGPGGRSKRFWIIVGAVVAVVVVLAAVLGGVFGSGVWKGKDSGNDNASTTNTTSSPALPQSILQGSRLSVTGWRKADGNFVAYLIYQAPKNGLVYSKCDSAAPKAGVDSTCWEGPVSFNTYGYAQTPIAATTIIWGTWGVRSPSLPLPTHPAPH